MQNAGPSNASGVVVSDVIPASIQTPTWTCVSSNGSCTSSGSGNINDTVSINAGGRLTYTIDGFIDPAATGILTNVASVTPPITVTDPITSNNVATDTTSLLPGANLQIKKLGPATAKPGTQITYTIAVTNAGPSIATSVVLSDVLPAELTPTTISDPCSAGFPCSLGTLAVNQSVLITVTGTVTPSAVGVITNTAAVTSPEAPLPPTSTVTTTLTPEAVLQIKKLGPATTVPGTQITYTIAVTNAGPSVATNVVVSDVVPAELSSVTISGACTAFTCSLGTLAVNQSVLITITGTVIDSAVGVITNTALSRRPRRQHRPRRRSPRP